MDLQFLWGALYMNQTTPSISNYAFASDGTNTNFNSNNGTISFSISNAAEMRMFNTGGLSLGYSNDPGALNMTVSGNVGIGSSTPSAKLTVQGTGITSTTQSLGVYNASSSLSLGALDDGSVIINGGAVYHDGTGQVTYVNSLETGNLSFPDDAGALTWINLNSATSTAGTVESYTAAIGNNPMLTVYGESDGSAGIKATSTMLGIGTTTPQYFVDIAAADVRQNMFRVGNTSTPSAFTINSSGYIGINSSTPGSSFSLNGTSGINPFSVTLPLALLCLPFCKTVMLESTRHLLAPS